MHQYWLAISRDELNSLYESAISAFIAAMREERSDQHKAFRHLMNAVLFFQLDALRDAVDRKQIAPDRAAQTMLGDRCLGYLFGLAANYMDTCCLPQQSPEAKAAIYDVHTFTFGAVEGKRIVQEQSLRHAFDTVFELGVEQAHKDVNSFKRVLQGKDVGPYAGLLEQVRSAIAGDVMH